MRHVYIKTGIERHKATLNLALNFEIAFLECIGG